MTEIAIERILSELSAKVDMVIQTNLFQKAVLTLPEAAIYTGRSQSNLYKLCSQGKILASKPEGKMLYFDRVKLESWMLRNPIRTTEEIEQEAVSRVAFGQSKGRKRTVAV